MNIKRQKNKHEFYRLGGDQTLHLQGEWRITFLNEIHTALEQNSFEKILRVDGGELSEIDTASIMTLFRALCISNVSKNHIEWLNFKPRHQEIIRLSINSVENPCEVVSIDDDSTLTQIGKAVYHASSVVRSLTEFIGHIGFEFFSLLRKPKLFRLKETVTQIHHAGINAVGICILVTFLIGIVLAYLTGIQIEQYGINIVIVDGVSLAMTRELSPILVAIIVAGRSGSAFTAQIGTMKLNEEVDAIKTLGLSPFQVLVLPRIFALVLVMPILVFVGDIAGIAGGMLAADFRLGVTAATFLERLQVILPVRSVMVGMIKAPVFAFFIATIGCRLGLEAENNAASVGTSTTSTVVQSIVAVILLNAAFAVLFSELGI